MGSTQRPQQSWEGADQQRHKDQTHSKHLLKRFYSMGRSPGQ